MESALFEIMKNNVEYTILPYQFFLLTFWGIWCPDNWSSSLKQAHNMFYSVIFVLDVIMCTEMLIHFVASFGTDEFKLLNFFFVSANITAVYKSFQLRRSRDSIKHFIRHYFNDDWLRCKDPEENDIDNDINSRVRQVQ